VFLKAAVARSLTLFEIGQLMCQTGSVQKTKTLGWLAKQACDQMDSHNDLLTLDSFAIWATEQVELMFENTAATAPVPPSVTCTMTADASIAITSSTVATGLPTITIAAVTSATALMAQDIATASACVTSLVDAARSVSPRVGLVMSSN